MKLSLQSLPELAAKGYLTPGFNVPAMRERTRRAPRWIHFGAGNIFRAFPAVLVQKLIEAGKMDSGVCVAECYDEEIIGKGFAPFDNLTAAVSLKHDGSVDKRVVGSIAEALAYSRDFERIAQIMTAESLQIVSMTITEKGYAVRDPEAETMDAPVTIIAKLCKLLYARYRAGARPVAMVSLDNCSHNGDLLKAGVLAVAESWRRRGVVEDGFTRLSERSRPRGFHLVDDRQDHPAPVGRGARYAAKRRPGGHGDRGDGEAHLRKRDGERRGMRIPGD